MTASSDTFMTATIDVTLKFVTKLIDKLIEFHTIEFQSKREYK